MRAVTEGKTASVSGRDVAVRADSICVHSDTPNAVAVAQAVVGQVAVLVVAQTQAVAVVVVAVTMLLVAQAVLALWLFAI